MIAHFNCSSGASGDMILGALIDAGADPEWIQKQISKMDLGGAAIAVRQVVKRGIKATKVDIHGGSTGARNYQDAERIVTGAHLEDDLARRALSAMKRLAQVEAEIHGAAVDQVHFHELAAVDTIVDIVGAAAGLMCLGIESVTASPVAVGGGTVQTEHGLLPVPSPAVVALLKGAPIEEGQPGAELTTPTGAAILAEFVQSFGPMPPLKLVASGYGAGTRDLESPNVLRILLGEPTVQSSAPTDQVKLEATIDDMNPEFYEYVIQKLFSAGAQDVWITPAIGKQGRPASILQVLASADDSEAIRKEMLRETSTLGVRATAVKKWMAEREWKEVSVEGQTIRVKIGREGDTILNVSPEYSDCVAAARRTGRPLKDIYQKALAAASETIRP